MTVEERIFDMMAQLDEHSEKIPEGMYLQFCDHLKVFHQNDENEKKGVAAVDRAGEPFGVEHDAAAVVALFQGPRKCGCCQQLGHNRRTCPHRVQ